MGGEPAVFKLIERGRGAPVFKLIKRLATSLRHPFRCSEQCGLSYVRLCNRELQQPRRPLLGITKRAAKSEAWLQLTHNDREVLLSLPTKRAICVREL